MLASDGNWLLGAPQNGLPTTNPLPSTVFLHFQFLGLRCAVRLLVASLAVRATPDFALGRSFISSSHFW
jgi:hypothetical protein